MQNIIPEIASCKNLKLIGRLKMTYISYHIIPPDLVVITLV